MPEISLRKHREWRQLSTTACHVVKTILHLTHMLAAAHGDGVVKGRGYEATTVLAFLGAATLAAWSIGM